MKKLLVLGSAILLLASALEAQPAKSGDTSALNKLRADWVAAANSKDPVKLTALYSDDAVLMPSNSPMAKGKTAIQGVWKGMMDQGARDIVLTSVGSAVSGDMGYDAGTYTFSMNGPGGAAVSDKGKYLMTVKRSADGKWWINYDIFNSDLACSGGK